MWDFLFSLPLPEFSSGYLIAPRCITDLRKNSLFIGSGWGGAGWVEDFWGDHTVLLGGQKRDLSSLTDCKGGTILLTANGGGELKILQSLMRGSSKSFHNTTKSPKLSRNIEKKCVETFTILVTPYIFLSSLPNVWVGVGAKLDMCCSTVDRQTASSLKILSWLAAHFTA